MVESYAILLTDNRYTDDIHYKGGCLANIQALSWCHFMFSYNARPPHPEKCPAGIKGWKKFWMDRLVKTAAPWTKAWFENNASCLFVTNIIYSSKA